MRSDRPGVEPSGRPDPLPAGRQIGGYRILERIGAGGMGEVYRAKDTRLGRDVAIKILPTHRAGDPEREDRFLREAQAASALNHPNILSVYDIGADEGITFIVSEFIPGVLLSDRIRQGGVPIRELISVAAQIADGLAAAHQARIVHRDLKPDNIIVTADGRVKILDFGLAKTSAISESLREGDPSTQVRTDTEAGLVLGTVPYMSPEQARGVAVDYRSDQFSLGIVIYELGTGVHPFRRAAPVQTLSAIIGDEAAPLTQLNPRIPAPLAWIVERCLAKDAQLRYASTLDLAHDLAALRDRQKLSPPEALRAPATRAIRRVPLMVLAAALAIGAGLILGLAAAPLVFPTTDLATYRFTPVATEPGFQSGPAFSPDGKTLAYVAEVNGIAQVFVRRLDASAPIALSNRVHDCRDLFWSPDNWIYFISRSGYGTGLFRVSAIGGEWEPVFDNVTTAAMSPDGKTLALLKNEESTPSVQNYGQVTLWLARAGTDVHGDPEWKQERYTRPPFNKTVNSGQLHFSPDGTTLAAWVQPVQADITFDFRFGPKLYLIPAFGGGEPRLTLAALPDRPYGEVQFSWLPDSRHIVVALNEHGAGTHLSLVDLKTEAVKRLTMGTRRENYPSVSRSDYGKIAFAQEDAHFEIIEVPRDNKPPKRLLRTSLSESNPRMSPNGSAFTYVTDRNGKPEILLHVYNGGAVDEPLVSFSDGPKGFLGDQVFAPEGQRLAYTRALGRGHGWRIWVSTISGAAPQQLVSEPPGSLPPGVMQEFPTWSHDNWIAFHQTQPGGSRELLKAQVGSGRPPTPIYRGLGPYPCPWHPTESLLACQTDEGLTLITSDGAKHSLVTERLFLAYDWDKSGRSINGLRIRPDERTLELVSVDVRTRAETILNRNVGTIPRISAPIRGFSETPNHTFLTSIGRLQSEIYILEGLTLPGPFADWFERALGRRH